MSRMKTYADKGAQISAGLTLLAPAFAFDLFMLIAFSIKERAFRPMIATRGASKLARMQVGASMAARIIGFPGFIIGGFVGLVHSVANAFQSKRASRSDAAADADADAAYEASKDVYANLQPAMTYAKDVAAAADTAEEDRRKALEEDDLYLVTGKGGNGLGVKSREYHI